MFEMSAVIKLELLLLAFGSYLCRSPFLSTIMFNLSIFNAAHYNFHTLRVGFKALELNLVTGMLDRFLYLDVKICVRDL